MSNEAAEKLRQYGRGDHNIFQIQWIDEALAAERKATVERIRATIEQASFWDSWLIDVDRDVLTSVLAVLAQFQPNGLPGEPGGAPC